jgi:RND family efflux transporter MFP subunit
MLRRVHLPLLFVLIAAVGCGKAPPPLAPPPPPEVRVGRAVVREVTDFEEFQGKTEAEKAVDVRAHVTGYLDRPPAFKDGDLVREGQVLFEIDPRPFKAELERTEANVGLADAHLKRLESDYGRALSMTSKSMSQEEFDKVKGDLAEARASLKAAVAARNAADLNVKYSQVTAPISGRISRRMLDPGNMVKADDTILTNIVSLNPIYAYFDIDERTFLRLQRYLNQQGFSRDQQKALTVSMGLQDEKGFPHEGVIDFMDNRLDKDSGSEWLRGVFKNDDGLLKPGLYVRVQLPVGQPHEATLIPEQALGTDQGQKFVFILNDKNEAIYRRIQVGAQHDIEVGGKHEQMRVVTEGVNPGDRVITSGLQRVRDGAPVQPKEEEPAKKEESAAK